jgi:4-alpha-glucanotransferase
LRGYWMAEDIAVKTTLGFFKTVDEAQQARGERDRDKQLIIEALENEGLLPSGFKTAAVANIPWSREIADAIHMYLARSPALLLTAQLDDFVGEQEQANLPGTSTEYPNWRRRLKRTLREITADPAIANSVAAVAQARRASLRS